MKFDDEIHRQCCRFFAYSIYKYRMLFVLNLSSITEVPSTSFTCSSQLNSLKYILKTNSHDVTPIYEATDSIIDNNNLDIHQINYSVEYLD